MIFYTFITNNIIKGNCGIDLNYRVVLQRAKYLSILKKKNRFLISYVRREWWKIDVNRIKKNCQFFKTSRVSHKIGNVVLMVLVKLIFSVVIVNTYHKTGSVASSNILILVLIQITNDR